MKRWIRYTLRVLWLKVKKPSCKYQFTRPKILVKTKMNRLSLVLTYISGQVLIFWQEGQKSVQIDIAILDIAIVAVYLKFNIP